MSTKQLKEELNLLKKQNKELEEEENLKKELKKEKSKQFNKTIIGQIIKYIKELIL